jgi:hypothetical protein
VLWPIGALVVILIVGAIPAVIVAHRRERERAR